MLKLLIRTIGTTFYQQHVGLFMVIFYLLFGMIQGYDLISFHKALLISICSSLQNLLILFGIWLLYAIKSLLFVKQKLNQEEYNFTKELTIISRKEQIILWVKIYSFLLLPLLCYAILMLYTSMIHQYFLTLFTTVTMLLATLILLSVYTYWSSNFNFKVAKPWINFPVIKVDKPFWTWPIWYLLNEQRVMFLICKGISFLSFKIILVVFADIENDIRVYLTALLAVALSHAILVLSITKFDAFYVAFVRHLPITAVRRLTYWVLILSMLLIPDLILLAASTNVSVLQFGYCALFCIGAMLMLQTLVYLLKADMERYLKYLLFFFFISMLAILGGYYLFYSLGIVVLSASVFLWKYNGLDLRDIA